MSAATDAGRDAVAAAWKGKPGCITLPQAVALLEAAQWAGMSARDVGALMVSVADAEAPEDITPEGFADIMDCFVASGFRHREAPMVTAVQLAALDEARRFLGLDGRLYVTLVRKLGGVRFRRQLDGVGFLNVWAWLAQHGADVPVPGHGYITRQRVRLIHEAAHERRVDGAALGEHLAQIGGVLRTSQLDRRGFRRVLIVITSPGRPEAPPVPVVPAFPGMVTQAQANLIWRLWLDFGGWDDDTSPAALDAAIGSMLGMEGGLASLTRRGAAGIIDRFMAPRLNDRRAAEGAGGPPGRGPPGVSVHDGKQQSGRARRRGREGRR